MTDNEIIKAFECCHTATLDCLSCPCLEKPLQCEEIEKMALDLIKRQQAEIESAKKVAEEAIRNFNRMESLYRIKCVELKVARAEAIKEFAEMVCKEFAEMVCEGRVSNDPVVISVRCAVKEMTEGKDAGKDI